HCLGSSSSARTLYSTPSTVVGGSSLKAVCWAGHGSVIGSRREAIDINAQVGKSRLRASSGSVLSAYSTVPGPGLPGTCAPRNVRVGIVQLSFLYLHRKSHSSRQ